MSKVQQIQYDKESDVLYLGIHKGIEEEFVEIAPGISVELDESGKVIGVEVLNASRIPKSISKPGQQEAVRV